MSVALITNYLPGYRVPLYRLLAERVGAEVYCFGGAPHYVPEAQRDLDRQIETAPFPAHRLTRERDAFSVARRHDAVIASTAGRTALASAYSGARRGDRPFILWASLWRHPRTPAHALSFPLMRRLYRRSDAVLAYGEHVKSYVASYRGGEDGVIVAPQAVEADVFARAVSEQEIARWRSVLDVPDGPLVLFVGRPVRDKGVRVLLDAWRRIDSRDATLCIVGGGPPDSGHLVASERRVRLAGRLPRASLPVAYASAHVVVVPSIATARFLEPWGLVCNEAMSQGRPVVATTAVGAAAGGLVRDGETGVVVPPGDPDQLAAAIDRLLGDRELRERIGGASRRRVADFSYERAAQAFERALEHASARARAA